MMSGFGKSGEVHRTQPPVSIPEIIPFDRTFSAFDFFDRRFRRCGASVRRCFSLARSFGSRTFVLEEIAPTGMVAEENDLLSALGGKSGERLYRLSFWKSEFFAPDDIAEQESSSLVGYVLVKHDSGYVDGLFKDVWYVFESVFVKYEHRHNCIASPCTYSVMVGCKGFTIDGVLYCQQNGLTKKCAHVALRSLLSRFAEESRLLDRLCDCALPKRLVVAEVSVAQLFPANEHKVAEVVFDASEMLTPSKEYLGGYKFSLVRMPGKYIAYLPDRQGEGGVARALQVAAS